MRKSQRQDLGFKGEITAMMALIFMLMLSVVGALIQSASIQTAKSRNRADVLLALENVFAEYDVQMLENYELFVRQASDDVFQNRLSYYGVGNMTHSVLKVAYLTDNAGDAFYRQAIRYMKDWYGLTGINPEEEPLFSEESLEETEQSVLSRLEELLLQEEAELPKENNPIDSVQNLKQSNLLTILVSNTETLSNRSVKKENLPSVRKLQKGNSTTSVQNGALDKFYFTAYLQEYFTNVKTSDESHALLYEQEYLLGGKAVDQANLEEVCKKILTVRTVANYGYLLTDSAKQGEAEALALTVCSLLAVPEITELVKQGILLAWAYGESIVDVRVLLKGDRLPFLKTSENWQLQLSNLVKLGTSEEVAGEKPSEEGLAYEDYLKGLLLLQDRETLCMRSLDLIESNLNLRTDQCVTKIQIESKALLKKGIQDTFTTAFGYQ